MLQPKLNVINSAIASFNKAVSLNPDHPWIYNNRGLAYNNLEQYDLAIADFTRAIAFKPNYAQAYLNRGDAYARSGNITQSKQDLEQAANLFKQQNQPEQSQEIRELLQKF